MQAKATNVFIYIRISSMFSEHKIGVILLATPYGSTQTGSGGEKNCILNNQSRTPCLTHNCLSVA